MESHDYAIRQRAEIMVDHFHEQVLGRRKIRGQARAMIICDGIRRAIQYYNAVSAYLTKRKSPCRAVVAFSGEHEDGGQQVTEATLNGFPSAQIEKKFQADPYRFLEEAQILGMQFSPDSMQVACMAGRPNEKWFVIVNGTKTTPRGHVIFNSITFSPDGRYLAYITRAVGGWTVVVNDIPGVVHERISAAGPSPLRFHAADRFHYAIAEESEEFIVEDRLVRPDD